MHIYLLNRLDGNIIAKNWTEEGIKTKVKQR